MIRLFPITIAVIGISLILVSLYLPDYLEQRRIHPPHPYDAAPVRERAAPHIPPQSKAPITILPVAEEAAASLNAPTTTADEDLATLELLLTTYSRHNEGNPVGENDEITAALLGKNQKHIGYLKGSPSFVNTAGQLIDRWSTPYFFHQISANQTEIRSAGPDRKFHTADDLSRSADDSL